MLHTYILYLYTLLYTYTSYTCIYDIRICYAYVIFFDKFDFIDKKNNSKN